MICLDNASFTDGLYSLSIVSTREGALNIFSRALGITELTAVSIARKLDLMTLKELCSPVFLSEILGCCGKTRAP